MNALVWTIRLFTRWRRSQTASTQVLAARHLKLSTTQDAIPTRCRRVQGIQTVGRRTLIKERTRLRVYNAVVLPVLLYNLGAVGLSEAMEQRLDAFHRRQLPAVFGVYWPKVITNDALYRKASTRPLSLVVKERRWLLFGQICRLPPDTPARKAMTAYFNAAAFSPRAAGKPRHCLVTTLRNDLRNASAPAILNLECAAGLAHLCSLAVDVKRWKRQVVDIVCA